MSSDNESALYGRTAETAIAKAIFEGLKRRNPNAYVSGEPSPGELTTIDGHFYLMAVARRVLAVLHEDFKFTAN